MTSTDEDYEGPSPLDNPTLPEVDGRPMDHRRQPKKKDRGTIPDRQKNGYYADHLTGDRLRSVTTILEGGVPKKALIFWAANTCTDCAIDSLPALVAASRFPDQLAELTAWIKRAHTRKKDERAEVGGAVHKIIEARLLGIEPPASVKVGDEEWALDGPELAPYIENFRRFEAEWKPAWTASEMVVANPEHGYAGTLDYTLGADGPIGDALRAQGYAVPAGVDLMGDTKTGGDWITPDDGGEPYPKILGSGHVHGVYPEAGLQMSAYRAAAWCWLRDGSRVPMPTTAPVGIVLHLRPEGYRLYPARCGDREYSYFRYAQVVDEWSSRISSAKVDDPVIGGALELPAPDQAVA
ncbi:hypothetical protein [Nocardioides speluncae]|uniref:hypothetical protein n=1 Tax=Nocardioides speluncae TaxID=2670337 RepID=UPI000D69F46F|nr:hypothetical protein [Nocardioides speluncae]